MFCKQKICPILSTIEVSDRRMYSKKSEKIEPLACMRLQKNVFQAFCLSPFQLVNKFHIVKSI